MADTNPPTWGVTIEQVLALAPHVGVIDTPAPADAPVDDVFGGEASRHVTRQAVEDWITSVGGMVAAGLRRRDLLTDDTLVTALNTAAHDAVLNGAASYLVAAAHPSEAGINNQTDYNAVLWQRYVDGLAQLKLDLDAWLIDEGVVSAAADGRGRISAPAPLFPDGLRW